MWDTSNRVFVYTTLNHVKYCLCNGDTGILRTLDAPVYVTRVHNGQLFCLDRECKTRTINIDLTEAFFKLALEDKNYPDVMKVVRNAKLCGKALVTYLQEKGYPEVALHFVDDLKTRFKLALACGNIEVAMNTAYEMGDDLSWHRLAVEALRQGNHQVVEMAYQRTKNFERLSFLYLLTGNTEKLRKMLKIAEMRHDIMARFHNALFLGDAVERVRVMEDAGQLSLAYLTSLTHGLDAEQDRLHPILTSMGKPIPDVHGHPALLIQPPTPILRADNWPLLAVPKRAMHDAGALSACGDESYELETAGLEWETGLELDTPQGDGIDTDGDADGWNEDLDLGEDFEGQNDSTPHLDVLRSSGSENLMFIPPAGPSTASLWCSCSGHSSDHIAAGSFETAMQLLHRQIAIVHFEPLKSRFRVILMSTASSLSGVPMAGSLISPLLRSESQGRSEIRDKESPSALPAIAISTQNLIPVLKSAYKVFQRGNFTAAKEAFSEIVWSLPFVVAPTRHDVTEVREDGDTTTDSYEQVRELLDTCREYMTAIRIKSAIGECAGPRQMELAAYFTHCSLQPAHIALALNLAMSQAYKGGNFISAASFARRLLELPEIASGRSDIRNKALVVLKKSEEKARNESKLRYDERNPFDLACDTLLPIYQGSQSVSCSFCGSKYLPSGKGALCITCSIASVGIETIGLVSQSQIKR